jgi:hypothetical protein
MMTSTTKLAKRLDEMAVECQADEKNVIEEMRYIMKTQSYSDKKKNWRNIFWISSRTSTTLKNGSLRYFRMLEPPPESLT